MANALNLWHPVAAPPVVPYRYGLFSVVSPRNAEVAPNGAIDDHWRAGVVFDSQACADGAITQGACIDPEGPFYSSPLNPSGCAPVKTFDPFTVYVYNTDSIPGYTLEQHMAQTVERLVNNEQRLVEESFLQIVNDCAATDPNTSPDLSDYSLEFSLGYLEQFLANNYGGTGVIYMSRQAATMLWENLRVEGARLVTTTGTPVVAYGGYQSSALPPTVLSGMFATGTPLMYRGDVDVREAAINKAVNEVSYIAQRDYVVGFDCVCMAATVRLAPDPV